MTTDTGISEVILAAKLIGDLVGKLAKLNDTTADIKQLNSELITIQTHALSALNEAQFLVGRNRELEEENAGLKQWDAAEAEQYAPKEIAVGVFVHLRKTAVPPFDRAEKLCSNCFHKKRKSFANLQIEHPKSGRDRKFLACQNGCSPVYITEFIHEQQP